MPDEIYVIAFESDERPHVIDYATQQASRSGAKLHVVHVIEWSPYSFLTPEEVEQRHARRQAELERAQNMIIEPALERVRAAGVKADGEIRHGSVVDIVSEVAERVGASMIFVGRAGGNALGARIFGSVPLGLAQVAPVPTVIVP